KQRPTGACPHLGMGSCLFALYFFREAYIIAGDSLANLRKSFFLFARDTGIMMGENTGKRSCFYAPI
ncbi:MAG: hypothetical protein K2F83_01260, partial [Oscillospiraceae bacterium]|nr:hypothetical protein [Oscillospiraceae bacterium]